ncbi:MAG: hypothetical protein HOV94_40495 [Saccharothrix sp.]|nr:hypothetical protein [Saccharothrix sp.]
MREWWSAPGRHEPNVFAVTGERLGAFAVAESLVVALADDPRFALRPTPVLTFPNMPIAYFLVRPPVPLVLPSGRVRVVSTGVPLPLPRSCEASSGDRPDRGDNGCRTHGNGTPSRWAGCR